LIFFSFLTPSGCILVACFFVFVFVLFVFSF
jgi:hypothetical protein